MSFYTEPVVGKNFFAREEILASLLKSAEDIKQGYRHNIAIIGKGLIGKSSLLLHFLGKIKDDKELIPVYVSVKGVSFEQFVHNYTASLLYHSLKNKQSLDPEADLEYLLQSAKKLFPKSCDLIKRIRSLVDEKDLDEAYSSLLDLNVIMASESDACPVIVLDEFNLVSNFALKKPFQILGQKIMVQQKTLFILSSSSTLTAKKILSEKLSLLFGGFKMLDIGAFTPDQAREFIKSQLRGITISDDLRDYVLTFTGGHPFYLSSIIQKLKTAKGFGKKRVSTKDLSNIIAELLFHPSGAINQFFTYLLKQIHATTPDRSIFDILKTILTTGRASDISNRSTLSPTELTGTLIDLQELSLISKSGSLYAITDTAFRLWTNAKSKPANLCFDFVPQDTSQSHLKEVEESIAQFRLDKKRAIDEKIIDLVTSFKNDQFFIDERVRLLPQLSFTQQKSLGQDTTLILTRGKKKWLFAVSKKPFTEESVCDLLDQIKSLKYNQSKIILISSDVIDTPAKLLAKQKKLWIWDKQDLSKLFEFYKGYNALIA